VDDVVIRVNNVSKVFKLPHEKNSSIKSAVVNFYRRERGYELQKALNNVSLEVKKGEFFGIVGRNGSGKSTLLKLLAGIYTPTKGAVHVNGTLTPFIELGVGFNPELTGRENIYLNGALLGFSRKEISRMYKDIVEFAELEKFMDQKLKNYSSGMQVRLAFSIAVQAESDILLVDEVLAVGDADFQRKCFDYFKNLKRDKRTVVFISHDMNAVKEFCERGILIDDGQVKFAGTASETAREYSKLFMEGYEGSVKGRPSSRLGSGDVRITSVNTSIDADRLSIKVRAKVNKKVDELVYGLHIIGQDGAEITSMNNRMINIPDVKNLLPGSIVEFEWKMPNIFSDGIYNIMLVLVDGAMKQLDYFEDADRFTVRRQEHSNTAILPPVKVSHKIKGG